MRWAYPFGDGPALLIIRTKKENKKEKALVGGGSTGLPVRRQTRCCSYVNGRRKRTIESRSGVQGPKRIAKWGEGRAEYERDFRVRARVAGPEPSYISRRPSSESSVDLVPFPVLSSKIPVSLLSPSLSPSLPASCSTLSTAALYHQSFLD